MYNCKKNYNIPYPEKRVKLFIYTVKYYSVGNYRYLQQYDETILECKKQATDDYIQHKYFL